MEAKPGTGRGDWKVRTFLVFLSPFPLYRHVYIAMASAVSLLFPFSLPLSFEVGIGFNSTFSEKWNSIRMHSSASSQRFSRGTCS